jgi:hypothetical protein
MRSNILLAIVLAGSLATQAQTTVLSVGATSMTVKSGTIFSADSLVLTPSSNWTLSSNNVQVSHAAVNVAPAPSINRVYTLGSQTSFTGTIQLYYQPSELNGNPESSLLFTDSAVAGAWLVSGTSTVNTTSHYVQQTAAALSFIGATASHQGIILALSLISFTAVWQGQEIGLAWVINQAQDMGNYTVQRSTDGTSWTTIGTVSGEPGNGLFTYGFTDDAPPTGAIFYRLEILDEAGQTSYSYILRMQKTQDNNIRLVAWDRSVTVYFDGAWPTSVRIINSVGETMRIDKTSRQQYTFSGLPTGVYFAQYELSGNKGAKGFLIN